MSHDAVEKNGRALFVALKQLLQPPIAFQRSFVDVTGDVLAALMLSQACYWSVNIKDDDWFWKTREEWTAETGMSRRQQEHARSILLRLKLIQEERRGLPARMYFRVNILELMKSLDFIGTVCPNAANQLAQNVPTGLAETLQPYKEAETTAETTSQTTRSNTPQRSKKRIKTFEEMTA